MNRTSLLLKSKRTLVLRSDAPLPPESEGKRRLQVEYCAICRTDGRMWASGHRDLVLPRIPGHEIAARDSKTGQLYTVWPGQSCGSCFYCLSGRDNLCDAMQIIGFHSDGGFSSIIDIPENSLIPAGETIVPELLCFAEPIGCILNSLSSLPPDERGKTVVFGGGIVGLLAALVLRSQGVEPTVIDTDQGKREKAEQFCLRNQIELLPRCPEKIFDSAINCCDAPEAFSEAIGKVRKGGWIGFFSGLGTRGDAIPTDILNLLHYKEISLTGSYGPRKQDMVAAVDFCQNHARELPELIEKILLPEEVPSVIEEVATGRTYKYIIDFRQSLR